MALISRTDYGLITINNRVLYKLVAQDLLAMSDSFYPCNKKGRIIKNKPTPFIDPDMYDSIEIKEDKGEIKVNVYGVIKFGLSISETANEIIDSIIKLFGLLQLGEPDSITVNIKGIKAKQLVKRDIQVNRFKQSND